MFSLAVNVLLLGLCARALAVPVVEVGFNDDTIAKVEADMLQIATHRYVASSVGVRGDYNCN